MAYILIIQYPFCYIICINCLKTSLNLTILPILAYFEVYGHTEIDRAFTDRAVAAQTESKWLPNR